VGLLDHPGVLAVDSMGLIEEAGRAVAMFDTAIERARAVEIPFPAEAVRNVAICGMGGSAIAGDLIVGAFWERLRRPVQVVRDYYLPGWVGEDTLVIGSSFSGTTEETLTCMMDAIDRTCPAVGISTGGRFADYYEPRGVPLVQVPPAPMPRAALVQMLAATLVVLERFDVVPPLEAELVEARETLARSVRSYGPEAPEDVNPAKQVAAMLNERVPLVWGAEITAPIAYRWKCQLNENAKVPAYCARLPEHNHNEIVGIEGIGAVGARTRVIMLQDPRNHRQVARRFGITEDLVDPFVEGVTRIEAEGQGALARMLDLVMLGDYASLYLACLREVDPGPITMIDRLKERLATTPYGRTADPDAQG
jgi:glucose/mannose-6-phosphate isomerase